MSFYSPFVQRYRPQRFSEVVGQRHIVSVLQGSFKSGMLANAYLFSGPHGIGKTSMGRIFAKLLNCFSPRDAEPCCECQMCIDIANGRAMDVIEIDAASNRRIDEIRQLRENVKFSPSVGKYRVYIIDEVHMLTTEAFNALLKTLEEPPPYVKFILATTHPFKLPDTIISRCQRLDFKKVMPDEMASYLKSVLEKEGASLDDKVVSTVVSASRGSMRDAESMLEQAVILSAAGQDTDKIIEILAMYATGAVVYELAAAIAKGNAKEALLLIDKAVSSGVDLPSYAEGLRMAFRDVLFFQQGVGGDLLSGIIEPGQVEELAGIISEEECFYILQVLIKLEDWIRVSPSNRLPVEMAVAKSALRQGVRSWKELLSNASANRMAHPRVNQPAGEKRPANNGVAPRSVSQKKSANNIGPQVWKKAVTEVMKSGDTLLAHTMQDISSVAFKDGRLEIVFKHKFALDTASEAQAKAKIEKVVSGILRKEVKLLFLSIEEEDVPKDREFEEKVEYLLNTFRGKVVSRGRIK